MAAQAPPAPGKSILANGPYQVGEHLTYTVSFASFPTAAHAETWIVGRGQYLGREGMELRGRIETTDVVSAALYAINNDYTTYIDPTNGKPFYTRIAIHEGGRDAEITKEYNEAAGTDAIPTYERKGEFRGVYDVLSAIYQLRNSPFNANDSYAFVVRGEYVDHDVVARPFVRELVKSSIGSFMAIGVEIRFPKNSELDKYRVRAYFTEDPRHVPLLVTAKHPNGEIRAEIASSEILPPVKPAPSTGPPVVTIPPNRTAPNANVPGIPGITAPTAPNPTGPSPNPARGGGIPGIPGAASNPATVAAANPSGSLAVKPFPAELPFTADEALNYTVSLQGGAQPVGLVSLKVGSRNFYFGNDSIVLSAKAETANAAQKLFLPNDQMTSYVDPVSLLPDRSELAFQGARTSMNDTVQLDQDRGLAAGKKGQVEIPVGTHDLLSLLYAARVFNLTPGKSSVMPVLVDGVIHQVTINSIQRETIQIGGLKIPAYQLSLQLSDDSSPDLYQIRLWISDDRRRLPLRFTAKLPLGNISADLAITPTK